MNEPIYVLCEDPRVLAEHQDHEGSVQAWPVHGDNPYWRTSGLTAFDSHVASGNWRYRLVFSDASEAGRLLVDYRDRLGARVEWRWLTREWFSAPTLADQIAVEIREGSPYRVAAPVAAEPPQDRMRCTDEPDCGCAWCDPDEPPGKWVLYRGEPGDRGEPVWQGAGPERWGVVGLPHAPDDVRREALHALVPLARDALTAAEAAAARPVPEPEEPSTERVAWTDAVGRRWTDGALDYVIKPFQPADVRAVDDETGAIVLLPIAADGTVEVLSEPASGGVS